MNLDRNVEESVAASPLAMVVTNPNRPDNPIEIANAAFCRLTGYAEREILGRNCRFLAGEETEPTVRQQVRNAVQGQRPVLVDILNYKRDGTPFRNGVMIAPLFDGDGKLSYFLGSQVDLATDEASPLSARQARALAMVERLPHRQRQVLEGMAQGLPAESGLPDAHASESGCASAQLDGLRGVQFLRMQYLQ